MTDLSQSDNALIIFTKNPELGKCKTRLAATTSDEYALKVYQELLRHTREIALQLNARRNLFYSNEINHNDAWSNSDFNKYLQHSGDLGDRMAEAFQTSFQTANKVVIIGSDCASLTPAIVEMAFAKLEEYPFVIGPTFDGGYYLLGMQTFESSVFMDIEWSTECVFEKTVERFTELGKDHFQLEKLSDIDYEEDWVKYGWKI
ncbi:MAG: TIGR04282 family arsenosugar biosynthesis glycosyltransferase [Saprospiraceae bacterium]